MEANLSSAEGLWKKCTQLECKRSRQCMEDPRDDPLNDRLGYFRNMRVYHFLSSKGEKRNKKEKKNKRKKR